MIRIFAVLPAAERESARHALVMGALFGLFTYATYELTNLATMEGWPLSIVFVDIAWGAALTGMASLAGFFLLRWMG